MSAEWHCAFLATLDSTPDKNGRAEALPSIGLREALSASA